MAKVNKREVPKYSDLKYQGIVFSVFSLFTRSRAMQEIHEERGLISFSFLFTTSLIPSDPKYSWEEKSNRRLYFEGGKTPFNKKNTKKKNRERIKLGE